MLEEFQVEKITNVLETRPRLFITQRDNQNDLVRRPFRTRFKAAPRGVFLQGKDPEPDGSFSSTHCHGWKLSVIEIMR